MQLWALQSSVQGSFLYIHSVSSKLLRIRLYKKFLPGLETGFLVCMSAFSLFIHITTTTCWKKQNKLCGKCNNKTLTCCGMRLFPCPSSPLKTSSTTSLQKHFQHPEGSAWNGSKGFDHVDLGSRYWAARLQPLQFHPVCFCGELLHGWIQIWCEFRFLNFIVPPLGTKLSEEDLKIGILKYFIGISYFIFWDTTFKFKDWSKNTTCATRRWMQITLPPYSINLDDTFEDLLKGLIQKSNYAAP